MTLHRILAATILLASLGLSSCSAAPRAQPSFMAKVVTLPSRGVEIPATLVAPANQSVPVPLVLLIHGHGGTREEAGGFTRLATRLAELGIASIRMDFPGSGESNEPFYNNNLTNMSADIAAARQFALREVNIDPTSIAMVGFSMGGRLAALETERHDYPVLVLWAAAVDNGAGDIVDMLGGDQGYAAKREEALQNGYAAFTTFWGQPQQLGIQWFRDLETSRPMDALAHYTGNLYLIHGSADTVVLPDVSHRAASNARKARAVSVLMIPDADHGFGLFDDREAISARLVDETVRYLSESLQ